jgi:hypothetical protein
LSDDDYNAAMKEAVQVVASGGRLRNETLRRATGLNYDQAIKFFNRAIESGALRREGRAAGTHYLLALRGKR